MDVRINPTGDDQQTTGVKGFVRIPKPLTGEISTHGDDLVAGNGDIGLEGITGCDEGAVLNQQAGLIAHIVYARRLRTKARRNPMVVTMPTTGPPSS